MLDESSFSHLNQEKKCADLRVLNVVFRDSQTQFKTRAKGLSEKLVWGLRLSG